MRDQITVFLNQLKQYDPKSVANAAGLHNSTVYFWLNGKHKPSYESITKVAPVIGLKLELK